MRNTSVVAWVAFTGAILAASPSRADDPCAQPICVRGHHYRGNQSGGRCQTEPAPVTLAMSHYLVDGPVCPAGWRVRGDDCVLVECCYRRACRRNERYRDGYCHRGPASFTLARSHSRAECERGESLDLEKGYCRRQDCRNPEVRPVSAAARRDASMAAHREELAERARGGQPPPPAVAGSGENTYAARITGYEPQSCINRGARFTIRGARFGARRGSRSAALGGHGVGMALPIRSWSDTRIVATLPDDARIENRQWYYVGIKDARGNWISNISRNLTVCRGPE